MSKKTIASIFLFSFTTQTFQWVGKSYI